jgi:MFS family permease
MSLERDVLPAMVTRHDVTPGPSGVQGASEAWFAAYGLVGAAAAGLSPILLPLSVSRHGTTTEVGAVMAALNLGGLVGPVAGRWADRRDARRPLLVSGCLALGAGLWAFPLVDSPLGRLGLALLQGSGTAVVATIASLLIVERHPANEWEERIASLQTFYGAGQVTGLLLVALVGTSLLSTGLWIAAAAAGLAGAWAWATIRPTPMRGPLVPPIHAVRAPGVSSLTAQGHSHRMILEGLSRVLALGHARFTRFLLGWLLTFGGAASIFALYPVLMSAAFGVEPRASSLAFGAAASVGLFLYAPAGRWSKRVGAGRVLRVGLLARVVASCALWLLATRLLPSGSGGLALAAFAVVVLAWSLLSVSATVMTAQIADIGEGPAMGLFNAVTSLAAVAGSLAGGAAADAWGYPGACLLAAASIACGLIVLEASGVSGRRASSRDGGLSGRESGSDKEGGAS